MTIDETLLLAAQGGDTAALEQVLLVCQPELRRYAAKYCVSSADAEDAVQESLVVLYRRLSTLRFLGALSSWLFQITKRECQRLSRKMFHRTVPLDEQLEQRYLATRTDHQLRMDVAMAIQSLPDIYREVIVLRDFEELTVKETAQRLSIPAETIKTRIHRARRLIREHLIA